MGLVIGAMPLTRAVLQVDALLAFTALRDYCACWCMRPCRDPALVVGTAFASEYLVNWVVLLVHRGGNGGHSWLGAVTRATLRQSLAGTLTMAH
jgi:hypothetical protein